MCYTMDMNVANLKDHISGKLPNLPKRDWEKTGRSFLQPSDSQISCTLLLSRVFLAPKTCPQKYYADITLYTVDVHKVNT